MAAVINAAEDDLQRLDLPDIKLSSDLCKQSKVTNTHLSGGCALHDWKSIYSETEPIRDELVLQWKKQKYQNCAYLPEPDVLYKATNRKDRTQQENHKSRETHSPSLQLTYVAHLKTGYSWQWPHDIYHRS